MFHRHTTALLWFSTKQSIHYISMKNLFIIHEKLIIDGIDQFLTQIIDVSEIICLCQNFNDGFQILKRPYACC